MEDEKESAQNVTGPGWGISSFDVITSATPPDNEVVRKLILNELDELTKQFPEETMFGYYADDLAKRTGLPTKAVVDATWEMVAEGILAVVKP